MLGAYVLMLCCHHSNRYNLPAVISFQACCCIDDYPIGINIQSTFATLFRVNQMEAQTLPHDTE